jgi:hypothetical protein
MPELSQAKYYSTQLVDRENFINCSISAENTLLLLILINLFFFRIILIFFF